MSLRDILLDDIHEVYELREINIALAREVRVLRRMVVGLSVMLVLLGIAAAFP